MILLQNNFLQVSISSDNLIRMINDIQFHADNEFFKCIHRKSNSCVRQTYFDDETNYANLSNSKIVYEPDENLVCMGETMVSNCFLDLNLQLYHLVWFMGISTDGISQTISTMPELAKKLVLVFCKKSFLII